MNYYTWHLLECVQNINLVNWSFEIKTMHLILAIYCRLILIREFALSGILLFKYSESIHKACSNNYSEQSTVVIHIFVNRFWSTSKNAFLYLPINSIALKCSEFHRVLLRSPWNNLGKRSLSLSVNWDIQICEKKTYKLYNYKAQFWSDFFL